MKQQQKLDLFKIICQQIEINYIVIEGLCRGKYCIIYLYDGYIFVCGYKKYGEIGVKMVYDGYNVVVGLKQCVIVFGLILILIDM